MEAGDIERGGGLQASGAALLAVDRVIALALPAGVVAFWAVSLAVRRGVVPSGGIDPASAVAAGVVAMFGGLIAALVLRGQALASSEEARRAGGSVDLAAMRTKLIVAWALLEGPALLAGVIHFVLGPEQVLLYASPIYLAGVVLTFPRAEWYGAEGARWRR